MQANVTVMRKLLHGIHANRLSTRCDLAHHLLRNQVVPRSNVPICVICVICWLCLSLAGCYADDPTPAGAGDGGGGGDGRGDGDGDGGLQTDAGLPICQQSRISPPPIGAWDLPDPVPDQDLDAGVDPPDADGCGTTHVRGVTTVRCAGQTTWSLRTDGDADVELGGWRLVYHLPGSRPTRTLLRDGLEVDVEVVRELRAYGYSGSYMQMRWRVMDAQDGQVLLAGHLGDWGGAGDAVDYVLGAIVPPEAVTIGEDCTAPLNEHCLDPDDARAYTTLSLDGATPDLIPHGVPTTVHAPTGAHYRVDWQLQRFIAATGEYLARCADYGGPRLPQSFEIWRVGTRD